MVRLPVRFLLAALLAGILSALALTGLQAARQLPLIIEAERHEQGDATPLVAPERPGLPRMATGLLANLLAGIGYALLLLAGYGLMGLASPRGLTWGLGGYAAFVLAPALGLPPELPGAVVPDLALRQLWWIATAAATAAGLLAIAFARRRAWKVAGATLLALPHLWRLPWPEGSGSAPPELAAEFAVATLTVNLVFWVLLGLLTALAFERLVSRPHAAA
ncbi:MAG: CbtA family protein [Alphaproteobacteria bacterium]|nr:CbtA family protein [Alphaproteobacteria bacterium]